MALTNILTSGKVLIHLPQYACIHNTYSMVRLVTLAIPSLYGCKAILKENEIFNYFINFSQKYLIFWGFYH